MPPLCKICSTRRPRRYCPGVEGDICAQCCGNERERTVRCPLDCPYLRESRLHDRPPRPDPARMPFPGIRVPESFLEENAPLLLAASHATARAALDTPGANDSDVRDALTALARTLQTRESGLVYSIRADNPVAAAMQDRITRDMDDYRRTVEEQRGMAVLRDAAVLGILVFLLRMDMLYHNGRPLSRGFIDFLRTQLASQGVPLDETAGGLLAP